MKYSVIENTLLFVLVIMMMLVPTSYMIIKLAIIIILILINSIKHRYKAKAYSNIFYGIFILIVLSGCWSLCNAGLKGSMSTDEMIKVLPFLVIWPFLYLLMIPYMSGQGRIDECLNLLVTSHIVIVLYNFYEIIALLLGLPLLHLDEASDTFRYDENFLGIATNSMHNLIFTTPFFFVVGFAGKINKKFFYLMAALTIVVNFMTSRTALAVTNFISIAIVIFLSRKFSSFKRKSIIKFLVGVVLLGGIYAVKKIDPVYIESTMDYYMNHFDSDEDLRFEQRKILIDKWKEAPITGHGIGTKFKTSARGLTSGFESTYHAMLANNGIIGFCLFASYVFLIFYHVYKRACKENNVFYIACLSGYFMFLVGAYSNPVMGTFDRLFPIYICLGCLYVKPEKSNRFVKT